jgi:hypothetical protein
MKRRGGNSIRLSGSSISSACISMILTPHWDPAVFSTHTSGTQTPPLLDFVSFSVFSGVDVVGAAS